MNYYVLSLGSNSSDREEKMSECIAWLNETFICCKFSSVYTTIALNGKDPDYLNAVVSLDSDLGYEDIVSVFKDYEKRNGRTCESKLIGNVPIDIDVVMANGTIIREKDFNCSYFQIGWKQL